MSLILLQLLLRLNFAASFAVTFLPFVLQAQVLYHVLIKIAESENEDCVYSYLLLLTSGCIEKNKSNM